MYLSAHPLEEYQAQLTTFCSHETTRLKDVKDRQEVIVGGMISSIKIANTRNPKPGAPSKYANFDLEDVQGTVRCICWPDGYENLGHLIQPESVVIMRATVDKRGGSDDVNLLANEIIPIEEAETRFTAGLRVHVDENRHSRGSHSSICTKFSEATPATWKSWFRCGCSPAMRTAQKPTSQSSGHPRIKGSAR